MCGLRGMLIGVGGAAFLMIQANVFAGIILTTPIALNGQPAPGSPYHFDGPFENFIGDNGFVGASLPLDNANPQDVGVWMGSSSPLTYLARPHVQAPGLPTGVNYGLVNYYPQVSGSNVLFSTGLEGAGVDSTNNSAAYVAQSVSSPQLLYRTGDPAPQLSGATIVSVSGPSLNRSGTVAWNAVVSGAGVTPGVNDNVVYIGPVGSAQVAMRSGSAAPGIPGVNFQYLKTNAINDSGKVVFDGQLTGNGVTANNSDSLWAGNIASPTLIARAGDSAPGTPAGGTFTQMEASYINNANHVLFSADYSTSPGGDTDTGLWAASIGAQPVPLMVIGQSTPGLSSNSFTYLEGFKQSDNSKVAFEASTADNDGGTDEGLWYGDENGLELIADQNGDTFQFSSIAWDINANGVLVWMQTNGGPPETASIYVRMTDGSEHRLLGPGDQIDVGNGDLRTIEQVDLGAAGTPSPPNTDSLSADGSLVLRAFFTDGSNGVFVTDAVPEPSTLGLFAVVLIAARRNRKR